MAAASRLARRVTLPNVLQIIPLVVIVAGLRWIELRIRRRAQVQ